MKRVIKASEAPLTDRQAAMAKQLRDLYQELFDILDDKEFDEDGEFFPLINYSKIRDVIEDELLYVAHLESHQ